MAAMVSASSMVAKRSILLSNPKAVKSLVEGFEIVFGAPNYTGCGAESSIIGWRG
jgi:hypothetical protein